MTVSKESNSPTYFVNKLIYYLLILLQGLWQKPVEQSARAAVSATETSSLVVWADRAQGCVLLFSPLPSVFLPYGR